MGILSDIRTDLEASVKELLDEYKDRLMAEALRLCADEASAEDLVMRTFEVYLFKREKYDPQRGSLLAWLRAVMRNLQTDSLRRRKVDEVVMSPDEIERLIDAQLPADLHDDAERAAIEERVLSEAVNALSPKIREAVVLHYFESLPVAEVARQLRVSENSIKNRLFYARKVLTKRLKGKLGKKPLAVLAVLLFGITALFGAYQLGKVEEKVEEVEEVEKVEEEWRSGILSASEQSEPSDSATPVAGADVPARPQSPNNASDERFDLKQETKTKENATQETQKQEKPTMKVTQTMKSVAAAALICAVQQPALAAEKVTVESLLAEMTNSDAVTYRDMSWKGRLWSSRDRSGLNADYSQYVETRTVGGVEEHVLMDAAGPGAIVKIWVANNQADAKFRFYIDQDETAIEVPVADVVGGTAWAGFPLSADTSPNAENKGHNLYLPIPYAASVKVAVVGQGEVNFWYNIETREYLSGTEVESFSTDVLARASSAIAAANAVLSQQIETAVSDTKQIGGTIAAGERASWSFTGPAAIRDLALKISGEDNPLRTVRVRMTFDGEETVDLSLGQLFGVCYGVSGFAQAHLSATADGKLRLTRVMPFKDSATVEFVNEGTQPAVVSEGTVGCGAYAWREGSSMHFGGYGVDEKGVALFANGYFRPWVRLKGSGVLLGNHLSVDNTAANYSIVSGWWGEGDERIVVDGETTPSYQGTGTEDFFGYAYGPSSAYAAHPFLALPLADNVQTDGHRIAVMTRERALDTVPFSESLALDVEMWGWQTTTVDYAPATFWYMLPGGTRVEWLPAKMPEAVNDGSYRTVRISNVERDAKGGIAAITVSIGETAKEFVREELFVAFGARAGGRSMEDWDRIVKIADIDEATKSVRYEVPAGWGETANALRFFLRALPCTWNSGDYATGPYAQFDAIDNGGRGVHYDSTAKWANLASPSQELGYLSGAAAFSRNGYESVENLYFQLLSNARDWWTGQGNVFTWEAYVTPNDLSLSKDGQIIMGNMTWGQTSDTGFTFGQILTNSKKVNFNVIRSQTGFGEVQAPISVLVSGQGLHLAYVANGSVATVYTNGVQCAQVQGEIPSLNDTHPFWLGAAYQATRWFSGTIHAARIYNRALTADDVARNCTIDVARFGGREYISISDAVLSSKSKPVVEAYGTEMVGERYAKLSFDVTLPGYRGSCEVLAVVNGETNVLSKGVSTGRTARILAGLLPDTDYRVRLIAVTSTKTSEPSEEIVFHTRTEEPDVLGGERTIAVIDTRVRSSGTQMKFGLSDGSGHESATLYVAYGPTAGGNSTNGWAHVEKVADVSPEMDRLVYKLPESWGKNDFVIRFFLFEGPNIRLPDGYDLLEYVGLSGGAYINTGMPVNGRNVKLSYATTAHNDGFEPVFGAGTGCRWLELCGDKKPAQAMRYDYMDANGNEKMTSAGDTPYGDGKDIYIEKDVVHLLDYGVGEGYCAYIDGELVGNGIRVSSGATESTLRIGYDPLNYRQTFSGNVYFLKMTDPNGDLVVNLVPARSPAGVVGMYDLARKTFIGEGAGRAWIVPGPVFPQLNVTSTATIHWDYSFIPVQKGLVFFLR